MRETSVTDLDDRLAGETASWRRTGAERLAEIVARDLTELVERGHTQIEQMAGWARTATVVAKTPVTIEVLNRASSARSSPSSPTSPPRSWRRWPSASRSSKKTGRPGPARVQADDNHSSSTGAPMEALELLTADHNRVRGLFVEVQGRRGQGPRRRGAASLPDKIVEELDVHTTIEEEIFYPRCATSPTQIDELIDEGLRSTTSPRRSSRSSARRRSGATSGSRR